MVKVWRVFDFDEVPSTQDVARGMIDHGDRGPFVVRANHQTAGRGRSGRSWSSISGNLQSTLVLPMENDVRFAANYSFLTAVALSHAISDVLADHGVGVLVEHKWPNDVWVNGKKIAGILLEIHGSFLMVGTGVNLNGSPEDGVCLSDLIGRPVDVSEFLNRFLDRFQAYRIVLEREGFSPIRALWLVRARGIGQFINVRSANDEFQGVFEGIEADGALRVKVNGDTAPRIVHSADVFFSAA